MATHYTYKFRLYPNTEQQVLLAKHFGCHRFIYNHYLEQRMKFYLEHKEDTKKGLNYYDQAADLTKLKDELPWLREVYSQSLQFALKCLETAYNNFFTKRAKFPKFHSRKCKQSFTIPQNTEIRDGKLSIPKFKDGIKCKFHREVVGKIKTCTVSKNPSGQYFACIVVERDMEQLPKLDKVVGIDLGLKTLAVCSDGVKYENIKPFRTLEHRFVKLQQWFARTTVGTKLHEKLRVKIAKLHQRILNIRNDYLHKVSTKIISENQVIVLEDLSVKGMIRNRRRSKSVWDVAWAKFVNMLTYKAQWYGREVVQISRWFPSSKMCHDCNYVKGDLQLSDREWDCPKCGKHHDRDFNASQNILTQGLNLINNRGKHGDGVGTGIAHKAAKSAKKHSGSKHEAPTL